jgi:hypothetical protein
MESNDQAGIQVKQPRSNDDRTQVAEKCCSKLGMSIPLLVDGIRNRVEEAYSGFPDRLYLIDSRGRVAYKGGRGPFGFKPEELEQALALLLLAERTRDF